MGRGLQFILWLNFENQWVDTFGGYDTSPPYMGVHFLNVLTKWVDRLYSPSTDEESTHDY